VVVRLLLAAGFFAAVVRPRAAVVLRGVAFFGREAELVLLRAVVVLLRAGAALLLADDVVDREVAFFAVVRAFGIAVVFLVVFRFSANL